MRVLASFVMQGRLQATAVVALVTLLSLLFFQPLMLVSSAAVALVVLRRGALEGTVVMLSAAAICALLLSALQVNLLLVVSSVLLLWMPIFGLALLLRQSRSLGMMVAAALLIGVVVVITMQLYVPADEWVKTLGPSVSAMLEQRQLLDPEHIEMFIEKLASWMPGIIATLFFFQLVAVLLLARWWQSLLYNPGGFRAEFHKLRLPGAIAAATIVVLLLNLVGLKLGGMLVEYLILLLLAACFLQGLALAHGMADKHGVQTPWLVGMYLLLVLFLPYAESLLSAAGLADSWFNFRARPIVDDGVS